MSLAVKAKAFFLILLLTDHEAARIQSQARIESVAKGLGKLKQDAFVSDPASRQWQEANSACRWSTWNGGCMGPGNSTTACKLRYLPLDRLPPLSSQACRYTDKHMLAIDRNRFFDLEAKLLASKAKKFAENCNNASVFNMKCHRRGKHMFRAIAFLSKAQDSKFTKGLTEEQRLADKEVFEEALSHMKVFAGDEADYVMMLKDKLQSRGNASLGMVQGTAILLTQLLKGNETERSRARAQIQEMSAEPVKMSEAELAKQREIAGNLEKDEKDMVELLDKELAQIDSEEVESEEDLAEAGNALVESKSTVATSSDDVVMEVLHGIAFIVIMFLVVSAVIWAVMASWHVLIGFLLLIVIGCGAFKMGQGFSGETLLDEVTNGCLFPLFEFPVAKGAEAIQWVWNEFAPDAFKR